jgi:hypothetical protein
MFAPLIRVYAEKGMNSASRLLSSRPRKSCFDPFGDQLLCMLREIASQGNQMPDFKAISNRVRGA